MPACLFLLVSLSITALLYKKGVRITAEAKGTLKIIILVFLGIIV